MYYALIYNVYIHDIVYLLCVYLWFIFVWYMYPRCMHLWCKFPWYKYVSLKHISVIHEPMLHISTIHEPMMHTSILTCICDSYTNDTCIYDVCMMSVYIMLACIYVCDGCIYDAWLIWQLQPNNTNHMSKALGVYMIVNCVWIAQWLGCLCTMMHKINSFQLTFTPKHSLSSADTTWDGNPLTWQGCSQGGRGT